MLFLLLALVCPPMLTGCDSVIFYTWDASTPAKQSDPGSSPESGGSASPGQNTPDIQDYYNVAADMAAAIADGVASVTYDYSDDAAELDLDTLLAYMQMLIPRHMLLRREKSWLGDKLESVLYECTFPLPIDQEFDRAAAVMRRAVGSQTTLDMTSAESLLAIHDWVVGQNKYPEQYDDDSQSAAALALRGNAVCSGYADAVLFMCDFSGIPCFNVAGSSVNGSGERGSHAWNAVYVNGEWLHLDTTFDDPLTSTGEDVCLHDFFLVTTEEILETHAIDSTLGWEEMLAFADWYFGYA